MFLRVSGYQNDGDDRWLNTDHIVTVRYVQREGRYDILASVSNLSIQVTEVEAIRALEEFLGTDPHRVGLDR